MLSKSLIQFSVDGWGCVPFLLFGLRPDYGRDNGDLPSKELSPALLVVFSAPKATEGHSPPPPPPELLDTHRQDWLRLLWRHCSFLLAPGVHNVLIVPSKHLFPQSYGNQ